MAFARLKVREVFRGSRREAEIDDIRAAFKKISRGKWGFEIPCRIEGVRGGVIQITVFSAPWRAALLWSERELIQSLNNRLAQQHLIKRIVVFLA